MRVIAGSAKGRSLEAPKGMRVRPTLDRVRESLFNILAPRIQGCRFLDLFAGSGANGIEALSRGANRCTFVDADERSLRVLRQNLKTVNLEDRASVRKLTLPGGLAKLKENGTVFDVIFADPPYDFTRYDRLIDELGRDFVAENGLVIIEHATRSPLDNLPEALAIGRQERYGDTTLTFFS